MRIIAFVLWHVFGLVYAEVDEPVVEHKRRAWGAFCTPQQNGQGEGGTSSW